MPTMLNSASQNLSVPNSARDSELEWLLCLASSYQSADHKVYEVINLDQNLALDRIVRFVNPSLRIPHKAS